MHDELVAEAWIDIDALADDVWFALTDPAAISRYMFGARVDSDWRVGSPIVWTGEMDGRPFEDRGRVLEAAPGRLLRYTHVPGDARPDDPDACHVVTVSLAGDEGRTHVTLTQEGVGDEEERRHSEQTWSRVLEGLKDLVEQRRPSPL
jgi:uncharacterized protein YndB with AHSA1/START domain